MKLSKKQIYDLIQEGKIQEGEIVYLVTSQDWAGRWHDQIFFSEASAMNYWNRHKDEGYLNALYRASFDVLGTTHIRDDDLIRAQINLANGGHEIK